MALYNYFDMKILSLTIVLVLLLVIRGQGPVDCSNELGAIDSDGNGGCICIPNFYWDAFNEVCHINCTSYEKATVPNGYIACDC